MIVKKDEEEEILFVVDISAPQINLEGKDAAGRLLLAAVSGRVVGRRARDTADKKHLAAISSPLSPSAAAASAAHWSRRVVTVQLSQVQAHVAPTDVDVNAGVQWLDEAFFAAAAAAGGGAGSSSAGVGSGGGGGGSYLLRQVFKPCTMDLEFTTHVPEKQKKPSQGAEHEQQQQQQQQQSSSFDTAAGATVGGDTGVAGAEVFYASGVCVGGVGGRSQQDSDVKQLIDAGYLASSAAAANAAAAGNAGTGGNRAGGGRVQRKATNKAGRPQALTEFALRSPEIEAEMDADQFAALVDVIGTIFLAQLDDPPPRPSMAAAAMLAVEGRSLVEGEERASAAVVAGPLAAFRLARWTAASAAADVADARVFMTATMTTTTTTTFAANAEACSALVSRLAAAAASAETAVATAVTSADALVRPNRRRPAIKLSLSVDRFRWALRMSGRTFLVATIAQLSLSRERHVDSSGMTKLNLVELALDIPPPKAGAGAGAGAGGDSGTV